MCQNREISIKSLTVHAPMDGVQNLFLLGTVHTDALQRLPRSAVRADERLIVLPGKGGRAVVVLATFRANPKASCNDIFLHGLQPPLRSLLHPPDNARQNGRHRSRPAQL